MKVRLVKIVHLNSEQAVKLLSEDEREQLRKQMFRKLAENKEMQILLKTTKSQRFTPTELENALLELEFQRNDINQVLSWIPKREVWFTPKQIADSLRREADSLRREQAQAQE